MPHIHCYLSDPALVWSMVVTDTLIGLSYLSISISLYFLVRRMRFPFGAMFFAFGLFIAACGASHFFEVLTLWVPAYWPLVGVKAITATASVITAVYFLSSRTKIESFTNSLREKTSELAQANRELKLSQDQYRSLLESVSDYAIFVLDTGGFVQTWNAGAQKINGYTSSEIVGRHFSIFYPPEDLADRKPEKEIDICRRNGSYQEEGWRLRKDGSRYWASVTITAIYGPDGNLSGFSKVTCDLTDRRLADEKIKAAYSELESRVSHRTRELKDANESLELALEAGKMGTWDRDLKTGEVVWSKTLKSIFGFTDEDSPSLENSFRDRILPEDRGMVEDRIDAAIRNKVDFECEFRIVSNSGQIHWIATKGRVFSDESGAAARMMGTTVNIDEQRQSQEQLENLIQIRTRELASAQAALIQSAKFSALGEMAGGIAHEINTPLAVITLKAQQIERRVVAQLPIANRDLEGEVKVIAETAKRIGSIIQGLRAFAREGDRDAFTRTSLTLIIDHVLGLCRMRFKNHGISIEYVPSEPEIYVECRVVQIEQVLLNLLNNAFDAVHEAPEKWVRIEVESLDSFAEVRIKDSGPTIAVQVREKLMQPFFTTKPIGKGTGLGLSISRGIVQAHHGLLELDAACPHTCFRVRLPKIHMEFTSVVQENSHG